MQFLYHRDSGTEFISLKKEEFLHLKVRRIKLGEHLKLRNLEDERLFLYEVIKLDRHSCILKLLKVDFKPVPKNGLVLALAVVDPKILEKTLPILNELGVAKLILVYTQFSQKNFKIDFERLRRIVLNSCEQCGRIQKMEFELFESTREFLDNYPDASMVDFSGELRDLSQNELYLIGPEGGFSGEEKALFKKKIRLNCTHVLRSQSAITAIAAKILI